MDLRGEQDIEQLRRVALAMESQISVILRVLHAKCDELAKLKGSEIELQQTLALVAELTSKELAARAAATPNTTPNAPASAPKDDKKPRTEFGPTKQPMLPVVEEVFELDEADRACTSCGGALVPMKGQFEESEMIDVVEVSYRVVKVKQQKYVCRCGACVETAPGPERVMCGGRYSLAFAIKVAIDKYLDHIPLARQERILHRHGLDVTTQTLWKQLLALAHRLKPVAIALREHALESPVIGVDQTSWKRLDDKKKKPWQIWCITAPGIVVHEIKSDKGAKTFEALLENYRGTIVCDAAKTHEAGARGLGHIVLAGCWAHVYRKYEEAAKDHPEANLAMKWIGELYEIDASTNGDASVLTELRRSKSTAVLAELKSWLWAQALLRTTSIGNAVGYTLDNWQRLTRFVDDPRIPLDNNATERGIRGPVIGRRNHFGSKSELGTTVASVFYSLIETAKLVGVNPAAYLLAAARAHERGEVLLPGDFARA